MSIAAADFSTYVVIPALQLLAPAGIPYSKTAHDLLMGTAAQESLLGTYLVQEMGPGVGVFMASPSLIPPIMTMAGPAIEAAVAKIGDVTNKGQLVSNLVLAAMLARCWYWVDPAPLPADNVLALGNYWKTYYNTSLGAGTISQWATNWKLTGISLSVS